MHSRLSSAIFFLLGLLFFDRVLFAEMTLFDFNQVQPSSKRQANSYMAIESYMEGLYGSDITVSWGTTAAIGNLGTSEMSFHGGLAPSVSSSDAFLVNGKGKNSALVLSFGSSPINSFALDWEVFRKGTGITIKADGVVIFQDLLTKSEKKTGVSDHLAPVFFDYPIHTLELIGLKKSKIGIDNLAVNIPQPKNDSGSKESADSGRPPKTPDDAGLHTESGEEGDYKDGSLGGWGDSYDGEGSHHFGGQVPEPATFILFGVGLLAIGIFCRKHAGARLSKPV